MRELALFAGGGGGLLGSTLLGWDPVCAVEIAEYPRKILLARQRDGLLPEFPIWDDVRTFCGHVWRGRVDVISGGFPCQDISAAGEGIGIAGPRSGLWKEYARIVEEVRPSFVFAENSPQLRTRGLGTVIEDLTRLGYDVRWCVLGARDVGAPHLRKRMWVVAYPDLPRPKRAVGGTGQKLKRRADLNHSTWWNVEPRLARLVHGVANRLERTVALGNGQVPQVAATAWKILTHDLL